MDLSPSEGRRRRASARASPFAITGRRLDARSRPPDAEVRNPLATDFSSRIIFPEEGCWRITGRGAADALTFVFYLVDELRRS